MELDYWTNDTETLFRNSINWILEDSVDMEEFSIGMQEGYNLISFPLVLEDNDVTWLLNDNPEIVSVKRYFNNALENTSTIYNCQGYFIEASSAFSLELEGEEHDSALSCELDNGMNLVGWASLNNTSLDTLPADIVEVAERNVDGSYNIATKYTGGWFNPSGFELEPGKGYWFKTDSQLIWSNGGITS